MLGVTPLDSEPALKITYQGGGKPCQKDDALFVDRKKRYTEARNATMDILHARIATTNMAVQTVRSVENL